MPCRRDYGDRVDKRGDIPPDLPALWAALGDFSQAESLAQFLSKHGRAWWPAGLAGSFAAMGALDKAERLVRASSSGRRPLLHAYETAHAWTELAWVVTTGMESARARGLARRAYAAAKSVEGPYRQALLLLVWSRVRATGGDHPGADALVDRACARALNEEDGPARQQWVFEALPLIVTGNGDLDRAESLVGAVGDPGFRARTAAGLATMLACIGERDRAETMIGTITDKHRRDQVSRAIASIRGTEPRAIPHRRARALTGIAQWVAGGTRYPRDPGDWPQTLVRHVDDPGHQRLIFGALAAAAVGENRARGKSRAVALADHAADIVASVPLSVRPQALVSLAWIVAGAMEWTRAEKLATTALELTRDAEYHAQALWEADLLGDEPLADQETADGLPTLTGSPEQRKWAQSLRTSFTKRRWGTQLPTAAAAIIARSTEARWWIENRDRLDIEFDRAVGIREDGGLPDIQGTPKLKATAEQLRVGVIRELWPDEPPLPVLVALATLKDAEWWVDHRDNLAAELADFAAATEWLGLPDLVGTPGQRKQASSLRDGLMRTYWRREIPLAVRVALNRLTDADWWISNARDHGRPTPLARAFASLLPRLDRTRMTPPYTHGPWPQRNDFGEHDGPCRDRAPYHESYEAVFAVTAEHGDTRSPHADGRLSDLYIRSCCGKAGWEAGTKDGEEAYIAKKAEALQRECGLSKKAARDQARTDLAKYQRALAGHG